MMTPENAAQKLREAQDTYAAAQAAVDAADDAVVVAREALYAAEAELRKARWGSVPCPVCGAGVGKNCRLERTVQEKNPGVLHSARLVAAAA